ncbi:helix-turn-helix domain-containing protein [Sphingobacterium griseoflavum]|uniref:Uncharacterized protein n=1 Tax=Sphingobacterium griseoflavum TaxID=1474952 RepID=A0ABQ3HTW3_9SPHI|nr:helix-turn-helix domain-containing protein [Sphingobacterium griseoflavum]GHE23237.1 hypothetical protein GCM10017764_02050 [Sphingobacterium griseoflavum]
MMNSFHVKTDINILLSETFYELGSLAQSRQIDYRLTLPKISLTTWADSETFQQLFARLIREALRHALTQVSVELQPFRSDDCNFHITLHADTDTTWPTFLANIVDNLDRDGESRTHPAVYDSPLPRRFKGYQVNGTTDNQHLCINVAIPLVPVASVSYDAVDHSDTSRVKPVGTTETNDKPILLLVGHETEMLNHLRGALKTSYSLLYAQHGNEALALLAKHDIALLISAMAMPVMDGIALCKHIKANAFFTHIPVILLGGQHEMANKIQSLHSGADAYMENTASSIMLIAQVENILENRRLLQNYISNRLQAKLATSPKQMGKHDFMKRLELVIYRHIPEVDLTVDELAKRMNMSRPTLYRKLKKCSAITPNELIHIIKLNKAAELLAQQQYNITQVAHMVGYSGQSNFSRDFHKHFGAPPSIYGSISAKRHDVA